MLFLTAPHLLLLGAALAPRMILSAYISVFQMFKVLHMPHLYYYGFIAHHLCAFHRARRQVPAPKALAI